MDPWRVYLLGRFELRDPQGRLQRLPTRKAEALLAALLLEGPSPTPRERLAALLWGRSSEEAARASLRQALSLLGKACGRDRLSTEGRTVQLADGAFTTDLHEFERDAAAPDPVTRAAAATLYRGELLAGLGVDEPGFDDWLRARRARCHEQAVQLLLALGCDGPRDGRPEAGLQALQRLLELDPVHEAAHRELMQLHARLGHRTAALRQYQVCVAALQRELDAEPEPATRSLYHELLRTPPAAASPTGPASTPVHDAPLIGRRDELSRLEAALQRSLQGRGSVLTLTGEAGVGKTRQAEELAARAAGQGLRVLQGRCHDSQRLFPFSPWVEALRQAGVPRDAALLDCVGPAWRQHLALILPELAVSAATMPADAEVAAPQRQAQLQQALVVLLEQLARRAPLLLVLEDLHWSDAPSLKLLAALSRSAAGWPLMVLATAREEDLAANALLQQTLAELSRAEAADTLRLAPLTRPESDALVRSLAGAAGMAVGDALAGPVWTLSEGNPLVAVEAVRAWRSRAGAGGPAPAPGALPLPEPVRDLVDGQLQRLAAPTRHLLNLLAVSGRETEFELLQLAAGLDLQGAAAAVEEAVRRRLVGLVGDAFDFTHARVRRVVADALLPPLRRAMHLALARTLEQLTSTAMAERDARLAYHYAQTDAHDSAVLHITRHAHQVAHGGAHSQALELLSLALDHAQRLPPAKAAAARRDLLLRQARSLFFLGRFAEVLKLLLPEQAAVDAADDARTAAAFYLRLGSTRTYLGDHRGATADAERALREAERCHDGPTMGKAHFLLSLERFWDQPALGVWHGEQAVERLQAGGEAWWTGQACWILGLNLSYRGRLAEGLAAEARADALAEQTGDRRLASYAAWTSGFIQTLAGDLEPALRDCRRSVALALDPLNRMTSLGILSLALVEHHEPDEALACLDEAVAQAVAFRIPQMHGLFLAFRAQGLLQKGRVDAASEAAAQAVAITREAGYRYGHGWAQRVAATIAQASGDAAAALQGLADSAATFDDMGAPYEAARTQLLQARWLAVAEQRGPARVLAESAHARLNALALPAAHDALALCRQLSDVTAP